MSSKIDITKAIADNNELMALPASVLQILESASRDEVSIDSLSSIIGKDPALTGRVLKIANSSFYGLSQKVTSLHQAVMILGLTTVKCLTLSAALFNRERFAGTMGVNIPAVYGNIISVAVTCRKLAVASNYPAPEDAFTSGLIHDIGLLYFLHHYPGEYCEIIKNAGQSGSLTEEERAFFGLDHSEAGRLIAEKWHLPEKIITAIAGHHGAGNKESSRLNDIVCLAVVLNRDVLPGMELDIEDKIAKIGVISSRLKLTNLQLDDIAAGIIKDAVAFAKAIDIEIEDYETILSRANQEIFSTYLSIQKLFKERQELTRKILDEERERGLYEAKQVAISTLSHYINNAAMAISGNSQVIRMSLKHKSPEELAAMLPHILDTIDHAIRKIVAVLEELSELNMLDGVQYYSQSKILNIDDRIAERMGELDRDTGLVLPKEAEF